MCSQWLTSKTKEISLLGFPSFSIHRISLIWLNKEVMSSKTKKIWTSSAHKKYFYILKILVSVAMLKICWTLLKRLWDTSSLIKCTFFLKIAFSSLAKLKFELKNFEIYKIFEGIIKYNLKMNKQMSYFYIY